jgi:hypothetical protein
LRRALPGAEDAFHGLREGTSVVVHYTAKGTQETAEEVDSSGKDGLHVTRERTLRKALKKAGKVTVYHTEESGRNAAHFFEKTL